MIQPNIPAHKDSESETGIDSGIPGIQADVLELIVERAPLQPTLDLLCQRVEQLITNCVGSIVTLDTESGTLKVLAAPGFPAEMIKEITGLKAGPGAGSCANTLLSGKPTFVSDVRSDERWQDVADLAESCQLGACWSFPIHCSGKLVASFALTSFEARSASPFEQRILQTAAGLAGFAIQSARSDETLRHSNIAFENTSEGIIIADKEGRIFRSNSAFHKITGFTKAELSKQLMLHTLLADPTRQATAESALMRCARWRGEVEIAAKQGPSIPVLLNITVVKDDTGAISQYVAVVSDISSLKASRDQLQHLAHHDPLTNLPNRLAFEAHLNKYLQEHRLDENPLALVFIDLDNFKTINDAQGHATGDRLLQLVGARIRHGVREADFVSRFGGDEFTLMLPYRDIAEVEGLAIRFQKDLSKAYRIDGREYFSSASIGIALAPQDGNTIETLIQNADAAMYRAKDMGRNCHSYYSNELTDKVKRKLLLASSLRRAIDKDELSLVFQPQFDQRNHISAVEALLRWESHEHGTVTPTEFIPIAEDSGLIQSIGNWVLRNACRQARDWNARGLTQVNMSINVSAYQLDGNFCSTLQKVLLETGIAASQLDLEITESTVMAQVKDGFEVLEELRTLGVRLAIDDFGTGYSSLGHLKSLPVQSLKIDRSLVMDLPDDKNDKAIVKAVVAMSHALDLRVIAEGVETEGQLDALRAMGCDQFQGYLLGKPASADEIEAILLRQFQSPPLDLAAAV